MKPSGTRLNTAASNASDDLDIGMFSWIWHFRRKSRLPKEVVSRSVKQFFVPLMAYRANDREPLVGHADGLQATWRSGRQWQRGPRRAPRRNVRRRPSAWFD